MDAYTSYVNRTVPTVRGRGVEKDADTYHHSDKRICSKQENAEWQEYVTIFHGQCFTIFAKIFQY